MSVVNDMLRDLEARKAPERENFSGERPTRESMIEQKRSPSPLWIVLIIVLLLIGVGAYWYFKQSNGTFVQNKVSSGAEVSSEINSPSANSNQSLSASVNVTQEQVSETDAKAPSLAQKSAEDANNVPATVAVSDGSEHDKAAAASTTEKNTGSNDSVAIVTSLNSEKVQEESMPRLSSVTPHEDARETITTPTLSPESSAVSPAIDAEESQAVEQVSSQKASLQMQSKVSPANFGGDQAEDEQLRGVEELDSGKPKNTRLTMSLSAEAEDEQTTVKAQQLFGMGRSTEAYELLKNFIASARVKVQSESLLAQAYLAEGRTEDFLALIEQADKPLSYQLQQSKARWQMTQGQNEEAVVTLLSNKPALEQSPDHFTLLASAYQKTGQYGKAFELYSELIQFNDQIADWWAGLGLSADQMEQYRQASVAYQQALSMKGLNPTLRTYLSQRVEALQ